MSTHVDGIHILGRQFHSDRILLEKERDESIEGRSTTHVPPRTLAVRARQAGRWTGLCLLTEVAVVAIVVAMGLLTGIATGHQLTWALGFGASVATPVCIVAAVVTAEILENQYSDTRDAPRSRVREHAHE